MNSFLTNKFDTLYELCSSGQSGSLFYYTKDKKYMMKTIPEREFKKFLEVLEPYYNHLKANPETLISRFFGLHQVSWKDSRTKSQTRYLVIMNNVFKDFDVGVRYDLKGSVTGRDFLTAKQDLQYVKDKKITTALKCNDFRRLEKNIILDEEDVRDKIAGGKKYYFNDVLSKDAEFFAQCGIIDYSLLLGEVLNVDIDDMREQIKENP